MSRVKPSTQHAVRILTFHVLPKAFLGRRQALNEPNIRDDRISKDRNAGDPNGELVPSTGRSPAFRSEDIRSYSDVQLAPRLLASPRMNHTWNVRIRTACLGKSRVLEHAVRILTFHVLPKAFRGRRQRQRTQVEHQSTTPENAGDLPVEGTSSPTGRSPAFRSEDIRSYSDVRLAPTLWHRLE